ncbi:MAG: hypothetical protein C0423_21625 [Methylibium sp.]|nr:hypothetical protein [Methylibium sp.]
MGSVDMNSSAVQWLSEVREQLASNARLRVGLGVVLFILWLYLILAAQDTIVAMRAQATQLSTQIDESRALTKQTFWPERAKAAEAQLDAIRALMWTESEQGLAEARMQDWVSVLATKTGVVLRDIALIRGEPTTRVAAGVTAPGESAGLPPGHARMRMRIVADFDPATMSVMLAELAQGERMIKVERLRILTATRPPLLEMELGAVARIKQAGGTP